MSFREIIKVLFFRNTGYCEAYQTLRFLSNFPLPFLSLKEHSYLREKAKIGFYLLSLKF